MEKGDHLFVHRSLIGGIARYTHHGVYVGSGLVVHYAGYANGFVSGSRKVERIALEAFSAGEPVQVRQCASRPFSRGQVVARALSRLGEDEYHLLLRNCEHFATWCCTGEESSEQVRSAVSQAAAAGATSAGVALVRSSAGSSLAQTAARIAGSAGRTALASPHVAIGAAVLAVAGTGYWALRERL
ncbi:lecithin retinol acyltransferase family protein [Azotobacter salinestris]|uniref:lecithin retinol acyltransferase family protein n=1 Tax=Azotobacter salinestris TaxID=69964 RepID=UPI0032DED092